MTAVGSLRLADGGVAPLIIVVDPSESALDHRAAIRDLVTNLLREYRAGGERTIHFLGTSDGYRAVRWSSAGAAWLEENSGRLSLLGPVFRRYEADYLSRFVVIGSGEIYDLADWEGTQLLGRTVFVSTAQPLAPGATRVNELLNPALGALISHVDDPVTEVTISGRGFLPLWWDNDGYELRVREQLSLVGPSGLETHSVQLEFRATEPDDVACEVRFRSGKVRTTPLEPAEPRAEPDRGALSEDEARLWRYALAGRPARCPVCQKEHKPARLMCRGDGALNQVALTSLRGMRDRFVVFSDCESEVRFETRRGSALATTDKETLVRLQDGTYVFAFERARGWRENGLADNFHAVGQGNYVVWL